MAGREARSGVKFTALRGTDPFFKLAGEREKEKRRCQAPGETGIARFFIFVLKPTKQKREQQSKERRQRPPNQIDRGMAFHGKARPINERKQQKHG